jgi:hypothetical protein
MNTIKQLLQDADPLRYEGAASDVEKAFRDAAAAIAAAASVNRPPIPPLRRGRLLIIAASALTIGISLIGPRVWPLLMQKSHAAVPFEVRLAEELPGPGLREAKVTGDGSVYLHEEIIVTNGDIARAYVTEDANTSRYGVGVEFTAEAAQRMLAATEAHLGEPLAILIDNEVAVALKIRSPVSSSAVISGNFTKSEAERIVAGIQ